MEYRNIYITSRLPVNRSWVAEEIEYFRTQVGEPEDAVWKVRFVQSSRRIPAVCCMLTLKLNGISQWVVGAGRDERTALKNGLAKMTHMMRRRPLIQPLLGV